MLALFLGLPGPVALTLAVVVCLVVLSALRGNRRFLAVFAVLLACRAVICAQFSLLFTGSGILAAVLGSLADLAFLTPLLFLRPGKKRLLLSMLLTALVVAANAADTAYSLESGFRLQYMLFENLDLTALLIRWEYFLLALAGAAGILLLFYALFFRMPSGTTGRGAALGLTALCATVFVSGFIEAPPLRLLTDAVQNTRPGAMLGVVADSAVRNFFVDALHPAPNLFMEEQSYTENEQLLLARAGIGGPGQRTPDKGLAAYSRVICVFVESLSRSFVSGPETLRLPEAASGSGKPPAAMPILASLMADVRNISLAGYHSSAFSTNDAIYAAFASRPDFGGDSLAGRRVETVFSLAAAKGFSTAFFIGSSGEFGRLSANYKRLLQVAEVFDKDSGLGLPPATELSQWGETDARVFAKALAWMRGNTGASFVIGISTIDMHPPFYATGGPPPGFADTPLTRALYSTDAALGAFVHSLKAEGLLDERTLLVISADHQLTHGGKTALEALPGGVFGDRSIPLLFMSGDTRALRGMADPAVCSAVDLAPTLGDLLGLPEQPGYYGKSLFLAGGHYDLALSRDGTLFFRAPGTGEYSLKLDGPPKGAFERALYKWYFNTQQGIEVERVK